MENKYRITFSGKTRSLETFFPLNRVLRKAEVSRTPARVSLIIFEQKGIEETNPWKGTFIIQISLKDVQELWKTMIRIKNISRMSIKTSCSPMREDYSPK